MALKTDYLTAERIDDELPNTVVTYGEPFTNTITWQVLRVKTTTITYRYRLLFMTQAAANTGVAALQADLDATGAAFTPPRVIGTAKAVRSGKCGSYDIEVVFANSLSVTEVLP